MKRNIYYYDTDCGGVVYHANYLRFFEEARTYELEKMGLIERKGHAKIKVIDRDALREIYVSQ